MNAESGTLRLLVEWFMKDRAPVIIALSGGVDSAVVALAAKKLLTMRLLP